MDSKLEERYIVIKLKDLDQDQLANIWCAIWDNSIKPVDCVVVESDWDIYNQVVNMVLE